MSWFGPLGDREWTPGKYRWRTRLRSVLPYRPPLYQLVPKGGKDCGNHQWYREEGRTWRCYHCRVGRFEGDEPPA